MLDQPQPYVTVTKVAGARPEGHLWNKCVTISSGRGRSSRDGPYIDLRLAIAGPLLMYNDDTAETKAEIHKVAQLANELIASKIVIESAWKAFHGVQNLGDDLSKNMLSKVSTKTEEEIIGGEAEEK